MPEASGACCTPAPQTTRGVPLSRRPSHGSWRRARTTAASPRRSPVARSTTRPRGATSCSTSVATTSAWPTPPTRWPGPSPTWTRRSRSAGTATVRARAPPPVLVSVCSLTRLSLSVPSLPFCPPARPARVWFLAHGMLPLPLPPPPRASGAQPLVRRGDRVARPGHGQRQPALRAGGRRQHVQLLHLGRRRVLRAGGRLRVRAKSLPSTEHRAPS